TQLWSVAGNGRQSVDRRHTHDARWNTADGDWRVGERLLVSRSRGAHLDSGGADTGITKLQFDARRPRRTELRRPCDGSAGGATGGDSRPPGRVFRAVEQ